jgi:hypothetical protein
MSDTRDSWGDYSKLVLKELERLNDNHEKMRHDLDTRLNDFNLKLNDTKNIEKNVIVNTSWINKVNEVWSPSQMKEAKDEIYKQKSRWVATIAVLSFIQIVVGVVISLWGKI